MHGPWWQHMVSWEEVNMACCLIGTKTLTEPAGMILWTRPANERWRYIVTSSLIGWAHSQNDPWISADLLSGGA